MNEEKNKNWGDKAPELKHYVIVFTAVALLIAFSWVSWFKWGWFH